MVKLAVFLLVLGIGGAAVGYGLIRSYLHSDSFRILLSGQVSEALDVEGAFGPLRWDGLAARTERFEGVGERQLLAIRADDIRTEVGLDMFWDGYWLLKGTVVRHLDFTWDARSDHEEAVGAVVSVDVDPPDVPALPAAKESRAWLPSEIRYDKVDVENIRATVVSDFGEFHFKDHRLRAIDVEANGAIDLTLRGGRVVAPMEWLPDLRLREVNGRYQDQTLFITSGTLGVYENGVVSLAGEWDEASGDYAFHGSVTGVDCSDLLNEDWAKRLTGRVLIDYSVESHADGPRAKGSLEIRDGMLTALPLLDSLSAYADTQRFRMLTLHEARADWSWAGGRLVFTNIRLASEGLARLQGTLMIDEEGELDGNFRLGIPPGTLGRIPGAETMVFQTGDHGLMWTTFRLSGTMEKPREDLTGRLIAAAGMRMFETLPETGERVLRNTRTVLGELPQNAVERALDVINRAGEEELDGGKILREAGNLLDSVLRRRNREPEEPEEP